MQLQCESTPAEYGSRLVQTKLVRVGIQLVEDVRQVLETLIPKELELQAKDGKAWYLLRIRPYCTLNNVIEGAVLTFVDITRLKLAEATLNASRRHRRKLFEAIHEGIFFLDKEGKILDANLAAAKTFGMSVNDLKGRNLSDPIWEIVREDVTRISKEDMPSTLARKTGQVLRGVVIGINFPTRSSTTWLKTSLIPYSSSDDDSIDQIYVIFNDVTSKKDSISG